ncbi:hypothetical protein TREES_T100017857 [Tupaia chinensis]|uniref:Uncharacterized protein n=1 Tax=Tupaia chinensis TaxID=246437 RepID=L9KGR6_TUPCH|nr:hypothetical protein TREES_T100017857 [Tupaia chinensis]
MRGLGQSPMSNKGTDIIALRTVRPSLPPTQGNPGRCPFPEPAAGKIMITFSAMMVSSILVYVKKSEIPNSQTKLVNKEIPL